jgi:arylsulfatase A-like enzyme
VSARGAWTLSAVVLCAVVGCGRPRQTVLITIDSLRDDHVGRRAGGASLTPEIDRLRADGVRFTDAVTSATTTMASHASMLTGLRPHRHGLQGNDGGLDPAVATLGALLRARGVRTGAVVSSYVLRSEGGGLAAGFEDYDESFDAAEESRSGQRVKNPATTTRVALEWVRHHQGESFFLWVHYFPPHGPYTPPAEFLTNEDAARPAAARERLEVSTQNYERGKLPKYQRIEGVSEAAAYRARYAAHVRYVDRHVGQFLAGLRELGVYERALVIATADHGESLGERGWYFCHGNLVYAEQSQVPFVAKWPASAHRAGLTSGVPVELVDVAPTVLAFFGLALGGDPDGQGLEGLMAAPANAAGRLRVTQSTDGELTAVLADGWKLTQRRDPVRLVDPSQPWQELFWIARDPTETTERSAERPEMVRTLLPLLPQGREPIRQRGLSDETREQLRQLGYLDGSPVARPVASPTPSPRR